MKKYYRVSMSFNFIKQETKIGTYEEMEICKKGYDEILTNIYETPLECKVELGVRRFRYLKEWLTKPSNRNFDEGWKEHVYHTKDSEYKKTEKWLEPYMEKYPYIFI